MTRSDIHLHSAGEPLRVCPRLDGFSHDLLATVWESESELRRR